MTAAKAVFRHLHRSGVIRSLRSTSSSIEGSPVTVWFETWPRVSARAVGFFADRHFAEMYPGRARTFCRDRIERGRVTAKRRRVWIITYVPSIRSDL